MNREGAPNTENMKKRRTKMSRSAHPKQCSRKRFRSYLIGNNTYEQCFEQFPNITFLKHFSISTIMPSLYISLIGTGIYYYNHSKNEAAGHRGLQEFFRSMRQVTIVLWFHVLRHHDHNLFYHISLPLPHSDRCRCSKRQWH